MHRRRTFHRFMGRVIMFGVEGPTSVWWVPPGLVVLGVLMVIAIPNLGLDPVAAIILIKGLTLLAFCMIVAGAWWMFSRRCQFEYFKELAARPDDGTCLSCGYALRGIEATCPECGTDQEALRSVVRQVIGKGDVPQP